MIIGKYEAIWLGWDRWNLFDRGFRFNGGGYMYGARPYSYFRLGPIKFMKYMR